MPVVGRFHGESFFVVFQRVRRHNFKDKGRVINTRDGYGGKGGKELVVIFLRARTGNWCV